MRLPLSRSFWNMGPPTQPLKGRLGRELLVSLKRYPDTNRPDMRQGSFCSLRKALAGYWLLVTGLFESLHSPAGVFRDHRVRIVAAVFYRRHKVLVVAVPLLNH